MEGVGVEEIFLPIGQEIDGPDFERRHGYQSLDVLHHHHGELEPVLRSEVHRLSLEDPIHSRLEVIGPEKRNEMADLIQPVPSLPTYVRHGARKELE